MITVVLCGERIGLSGAPELERALATRYGAFVLDGDADVRLELEIAPGFRGDYAAPAELFVELDGDERLVFEGEAEGSFPLAEGRGTLRGVRDLGAIDAVLRAVATQLGPRRGRLLLHGLLAPVGDAALVLVGASGAGKSTAARALGAACDELVEVDAERAWARSTPYWGARRVEAPVRALGVLGRSPAEGAVRRLRGADAVRLLAPHVVRYVTHPVTERAIFAQLATLAARGIWRIEAPVGAGFPAFIRDAAEGLSR